MLDYMAAYYHSEGRSFSEKAAAAAVRDFIARPSAGKLQLVTLNGVPVGYHCLVYGYSLEHHGRDAFLDEIYISPEHQRSGVGSRVLQLLTATLKRNGFRALHLVAMSKRMGVQRFYQRNGFIKQRVVFMTKVLAASRR